MLKNSASPTSRLKESALRLKRMPISSDLRHSDLPRSKSASTPIKSVMRICRPSPMLSVWSRSASRRNFMPPKRRIRHLHSIMPQTTLGPP